MCCLDSVGLLLLARALNLLARGRKQAHGFYLHSPTTIVIISVDEARTAKKDVADDCGGWVQHVYALRIAVFIVGARISLLHKKGRAQKKQKRRLLPPLGCECVFMARRK